MGNRAKGFEPQPALTPPKPSPLNEHVRTYRQSAYTPWRFHASRLAGFSSTHSTTHKATPTPTNGTSGNYSNYPQTTETEAQPSRPKRAFELWGRLKNLAVDNLRIVSSELSAHECSHAPEAQAHCKRSGLCEVRCATPIHPSETWHLCCGVYKRAQAENVLPRGSMTQRPCF